MGREPFFFLGAMNARLAGSIGTMSCGQDHVGQALVESFHHFVAFLPLE